MTLPLNKLNPKWIGLLRHDSGEGVQLDCPHCGPSHTLVAYFENPLDDKPAATWQKPTWKRIGADFDTLTIEPSIQYPCFHGWVEDGLVIDISEAPAHARLPNGQIVALSPRQFAQLRLQGGER